MCVPVVSCVSQGAVAGDALALSLVEGVQGVGVVSGLPAPGAQVTPLIEPLQHVLPLCIRDLSTKQSKSQLGLQLIIFLNYPHFVLVNGLVYKM